MRVALRRPLSRALGLAAAAALVSGSFGWAQPAAAGPLATPWSGGGSATSTGGSPEYTGTTTVVSDGTAGPAEFSYAYLDDVGGGFSSSGSWTFSTTAATSGPVELAWSYTGSHAFFQVRVGLTAFVTSGGPEPSTVTVPLVTAGPADCCGNPPSEGFAYAGTTTLTVAAGDTYGFTMTGSNGDTNSTLTGTLRVARPIPAAPILFAAVPEAQPGALGVAGLVAGEAPAGTSYDVTVYAAASCTAEPFLTETRTVTTNENGVAAFAIDDFPPVPAGRSVWATASAGGDSSPSSNCLRVGPNNTSWTTAQLLDPNGSTDGFLETQGEGRWFKVPVLPNSRVNVRLSGLPADYDLVVFGDIAAAYAALVAGASTTTGPGLALDDLAKQGAETPADVFNTSQYNPSSWDPTNWDPTLNTAGFSPSQWSPSQWSPSQWSASQWAPSQWSPSQWSPSQWSPSQWSPSQWSPSQWSPSQWSPSQWSGAFPSDPGAFSGAQTASLLAVAAGTGTADESVSVNTWDNTGSFYVRVQGKNGSFDPDAPFTLSVERDGSVCEGVVDRASAPTAPAEGWRTVILTDGGRMASDPTLAARLADFAARPEVAGHVVDVNDDPDVRWLNAQADANASCPHAKNLVASAIKRIVDAHRASNPVEYVVVIGDDAVIPFFRYADPALLGNETMYRPPVLDDSASQASLRLGYVLNQDGYGSSASINLHGNQFPVPDLAVGRLVETPAEIVGMLDAYLSLTPANGSSANGVVRTPTSSLTTGYDFLQDAADEVAANLAAGIGGAGNATLITDQQVAPATVTVGGVPDRDHSWTGPDLRKALLQSGRHDLVFLAGHFSANDALAADYATNVLSTELLTAPDGLFTNAIVFSAGCHSGYNIVNDDAVPSVTEPIDWAQAFAARGATLIAGTGYQYGDTEFLAHSERLYAEFARQLRVTTDPTGGREPVAIGSALLRAKRLFLQTTPILSALDEKSLLQVTLFGLPMLGVDLPAGRIYEAPEGTTIPAIAPVAGGPGAALGLRVADTAVDDTGVVAEELQLVASGGGPGPLATYLRGPDGVVVLPTQPILPLVSRNVTAPDAGYIVRGVGFRGGTYVDTPAVTPLTGAPATELRGIYAPYFTDVHFPVQPWSVNYFDAIGGGGATRLMVMPAQHLSDGPVTSARRAFSNLDFRLFYSNNLGRAALAAPPTITGIQTSFDETTRALTFSARIVGDVAAGIQEAWVTWTVPPAAGQTGTWDDVVLARSLDDPTLWQGTLVLAAGVDPGSVAFMVQAVNGAGRVTLDANVGAFYRPGSVPGAPGGGAAPAPTEIAFTPAPPAMAAYGTSFQVTATLTAGGNALAGKLVKIGVGASGIPATTNASGEATVTLRAAFSPSEYLATASFAGDAVHAASSASSPVTVTAQPTTLELSGTLGSRTLGSGLAITATLRDTQDPPVPLHQRTVFVILRGSGSLNGSVTRVITGRTDPLGRVDVPAAVLDGLPAGPYAVDAYFNGVNVPGVVTLERDDVDYGPSEAHDTLVLQWPFSGFFQPVDNPPTLNVVNAGSAVPVKFSLGGDRGLAILVGGAPVVTTIPCPGAATLDTIETTVAASTSGLRYDAASGQYIYSWKTARGSTGCRQLTLKLVDGSEHVALFKFK